MPAAAPIEAVVLVNENEASRLLSISTRTLQAWRLRGIRPLTFAWDERFGISEVPLSNGRFLTPSCPRDADEYRAAADSGGACGHSPEIIDVKPASGTQTPIAQLVAQMLTDGWAPETIVEAVAAAEQGARRVRSAIAKRGERLPPEWQPSASAISFALGRTLTPAQVEIEAEKFRTLRRKGRQRRGQG